MDEYDVIGASPVTDGAATWSDIYYADPGKDKDAYRHGDSVCTNIGSQPSKV